MGFYSVRFGSRMWVDFKVISTDENSNKFQKTRFWKEKSVEDMVSLGPSAQATLEHDSQMFSLVIPQLNST
jgi:hypothetical protein